MHFQFFSVFFIVKHFGPYNISGLAAILQNIIVGLKYLHLSPIEQPTLYTLKSENANKLYIDMGFINQRVSFLMFGVKFGPLGL